jgi:hypothetical protein
MTLSTLPLSTLPQPIQLKRRGPIERLYTWFPARSRMLTLYEHT